MAARQSTASRRVGRPAGPRIGQRRERKPATGDRRDLILQAAARRFAEFGFEATTVRQIADDVSLLSGSLYHHFGTKEEILEEIVRDAVFERLDRSKRIAALPLSAEERFVALIVDDLVAFTSRQAVHAIVFNERKFFRRSEYFGHLMKARKETYLIWQNVLEQGIREGLFRPDTDIYLTISTIVRMLNSGADWYAHEDGSPIDAIANYEIEQLIGFFVGFILRAIRSPERAAEPIPRPEIEF